MVWLALASVTPVIAQDAALIAFNKPISLARNMGANATAASILCCCEPNRIGIGNAVYYLLDLSNLSSVPQTVTLTDTLPTSFVPIAGPQCFGGFICDLLITVLRNGECLCRQEGMRKRDKETCGP